jgi:hypothetical protein
LFKFLRNGGLRFGRWIRQAQYSPQCGVMAKIPQAERLAGLSQAEQYAAVELFRGTIVTHSLIAYRDDVQPLPAIDLCCDAWNGYVPIRMPDTICLEESLPDDAAGVLINRTHTYRDIYLPIRAAEKRMFDAIDGNRTVSEVAARTVPSARKPQQMEITRSFFGRLWQYDQIVFDASGRP